MTRFLLTGIAAIVLTACTNGMLGESLYSSSTTTSSSSSEYTDDPVLVSGETLEIEGTVVASYLPYFSTVTESQFGIVVSYAAALEDKLGSDELEEYLEAVVDGDEAVEEAIISVQIPAFASKVKFTFKKAVTTAGILKNALVIQPDGQVILTYLESLPDSAVAIQTENQDVILAGGTKDGVKLNQLVMITADGLAFPSDSTSTTWGRTGMLYTRDDQPMVLTYRFAETIYSSLLNEIAVGLLAQPSVYGSLSNPSNLVMVQFKTGAARTAANVREIRLIVFSSEGADPTPVTWCNSSYSSSSTQYEAYGCTTSSVDVDDDGTADADARQTVLQAAIDAQASEQGSPPTSGELGSSATSGFTIEPLD